jgi:hypothetical protein
MTHEEIGLTRRFVVDAGYRWRAGVIKAIDGFPRRWLFWLGAVILLILFFSPANDGKPAAIAAVLALMLGFGLMSVIVTSIVINRAYPPGSVLEAGFGEREWVLQTSGCLTRLPYTAFSNARRRGEFVFMRVPGSRDWDLFPGPLFGDRDLVRFPK